jgi:hypothetical protein
MRTGDHVLHRPTGEHWTVAWVDEKRDELGWCGWPEGYAKLSDCELQQAASDDVARTLAREICSSRSDWRRSQVRHLHPDLIEEPTL